jgi:hypothetical protein
MSEDVLESRDYGFFENSISALIGKTLKKIMKVLSHYRHCLIQFGYVLDIKQLIATVASHRSPHSRCL